jgi:DNA-binding transcriptional MerR regulator
MTKAIPTPASLDRLHLTIGQLAARCAVPRTTVLYYEQVGLLAPAARSEAGYRLYGDAELARVQQICAWRATGLTHEAIRGLLAGGERDVAIHTRLADIQRTMQQLRQQQALLVALLGGGVLAPAPADAFEDLFQEKGLDDAAMHRWHTVFKRQNPEAHQAFLRSLGLNDEEIARIVRS